MTRARLDPIAAFVLLGLAFGAGCGSDRQEPRPFEPPVLETRAGDSTAREFYPLSIGDDWGYHRDHTLVVEVIVGPPYKRVETFEGTVERVITGTQDVEGVTYFVERTTLTPSGKPPTKPSWIRYRQDHSGLYEADIATTEPPPSDEGPAAIPPSAGRLDPRPRSADENASAADAMTAGCAALGEVLSAAADRSAPPIVRRALREHARRLERIETALAPLAGPAPRAADRPEAQNPGGDRPGEQNPVADRPGGEFPGELLALDYPLHAGAAWFTRVEPFFVRSVVEGHEALDLPAGKFPVWRIRINSEFLDPEDRVVVWYGRCGFLASSIHTETLALDPETGETARITADDNEMLTDVRLAEPGGCN